MEEDLLSLLSLFVKYVPFRRLVVVVVIVVVVVLLFIGGLINNPDYLQ